MFLTCVTLLTALCISSVAIYYSVVGLTTIFAASVIPVAIMGTTLEIGKLATVLWLHKYWKQAIWWLKTYLLIAVALLMVITSMGIFGYLSKSHVEQTASSRQNIAKIEQIEKEIARHETIISRSEAKIQQLEQNGSGADQSIQRQIEIEQQRIDTAYDRVKPQIEQQLAIIKKEREKIQQQLIPYREQIQTIDSVLNTLQQAINNNNIRKAQGIVGTKIDGSYGPATARSIQQFRQLQEEKRQKALADIERLSTTNTSIQTAQQFINNINQSVKREIQDSNRLIDRLRNKIGQDEKNNVAELINVEKEKINKSTNSLDKLIEEKFSLETQYRKLEAEVGPIKYIAEMVYADADNDMLEKAVRWVIIIIIIVFDPLAVLLLIASQFTFELNKKDKLKSNPKVHRISKNTTKTVLGLNTNKYNNIQHETTNVSVEKTKQHNEIKLTSHQNNENIHEQLDIQTVRVNNKKQPLMKQTPIQESSENESEIASDDLIIEEPEPSITDVEQLKDTSNDNSMQILQQILDQQSDIMDELTRRKKVTESIRTHIPK